MLNKIAVIAVSLMLMTFVSLGKAVAEEAATAATGTQAQAKAEVVNATVEEVTAPAAQAKPAAATPAFPTGLTPVMVGPLEVTPSAAKVILSRQGQQTCFNTKLFLRIRNTSSADVKIIGFSRTIAGTDNKGMSLFHGVVGSGILLSDASTSNLYQAFVDEASKLVTMSPNQSVEIQIATQNYVCIDDNDLKIYSVQRNKTGTFSGNLGIVPIDGAPELRPFSISDVPLTVTTK